jgi:hypothetical protein
LSELVFTEGNVTRSLILNVRRCFSEVPDHRQKGLTSRSLGSLILFPILFIAYLLVYGSMLQVVPVHVFLLLLYHRIVQGEYGKCLCTLFHYATSRKVAVSIFDEVTGFFLIDVILPTAIWLGPITELSTRNLPPG